MDIIKNWHLHEFNEMEANIEHESMDVEYLFYQAVTSGDIRYVEENCKQGSFMSQAGKGVLSKNPLVNIKYHFVVTAAMITRFCAAAGMVPEKAYRLSDYYIQLLDDANSLKEVESLHDKMVLDYTNQMYSIHKTQNDTRLSHSISLCIDYIYNHLNERITVDELADQIGLSRSYLSRLFKQELNTSVSDYIRCRKLDRAKNLLQYSDYSYIEIANYLAFASQSHFIRAFEEYVGMTPKKYRDRYYRTTWRTD